MNYFECKICGYETKSKQGLGIHVRKLHHLSSDEYFDMFFERQKCCKCSKELKRGYNGKSGMCKACSDKNRFGENNPMYGVHLTVSDETKEKISTACKLLWKNEDYRQKVIIGISKPRPDQFGEEQSIRVTKWFEEHPEQRILRSIQMKKSWEEGTIEPNINSINESKQERNLRSLLVDALPNREVFKKTIKCDGKWFYPDITIDNKFIVEFFGTMWHADPRVYKDPEQIVHHGYLAKDIWDANQKRVEILTLMGYHVKIVWQTDFHKRENEVVEEIKTWIQSFV